MIAYHTDYDPYAAQGKAFYCFFFFLWSAINHSLLLCFPLTPIPTPPLMKAHWKGHSSTVNGQRTKASVFTPTNLSWFYIYPRKCKMRCKTKQKQREVGMVWESFWLQTSLVINVQILSLLGWAFLQFWDRQTLAAFIPVFPLHLYTPPLECSSHHIIMGTGVVLSFLMGTDYVPSSLCPWQAPNIVVPDPQKAFIEWIEWWRPPTKVSLSISLPSRSLYLSIPRIKKKFICSASSLGNERGVGFLRTWTCASSLHFLLLGNLIYSHGFRNYILLTPKFVPPSHISSLICLASFPRINSQLPAWYLHLNVRKILKFTCLKWNSCFPFSHLALPWSSLILPRSIDGTICHSVTKVKKTGSHPRSLSFTHNI